AQQQRQSGQGQRLTQAFAERRQQRQEQRQQNAGEKLPEPRQGVEIHPQRVLLQRPKAVGEGQQGQRRHPQQQRRSRFKAPHQPQADGQDAGQQRIELDLHGQGPELLERAGRLQAIQVIHAAAQQLEVLQVQRAEQQVVDGGAPQRRGNVQVAQQHRAQQHQVGAG